jgi:outer membrane receptor protein involved in Fe transport
MFQEIESAAKTIHYNVVFLMGGALGVQQGGSMLFKTYLTTSTAAVFALSASIASADDAIDLKDLVVSSSRYEQSRMDVPANTTTITREDIENSGARTLSEALRAVPGLQIGTQGNAYPHIAVRGFRDTKDLAILIDGVPFRQVGGSADLTMLPLNIVERIEFVKGPGSAIWGRGAVGGVLNIITKPADASQQSADVEMSIGSFGTYETSTRGVLPWKDGYALVNLARGMTDGFQDNTDKDTANAMLQVHQKLSDRFSMTAQFLHSYVDANRGSTTPLVNGEPAYGVGIEDNYAVPGAKFHGVYDSLTLAPQVELAPGVVVENSFTYANYDRLATGGTTILPTTSTKGWWQSDTEQHSVSNDLHLTWDKRFDDLRNTVITGMYYERGKQKVVSPSYSGAPTYSGSTSWSTPSNSNPATGVQTGTTITNSDEETVSVYFQDRIEIGQVGLQAGIRYDRIESGLSRSNTSVTADQNDDRFSPRVGADWRFYNDGNTDLMAFASYAEGFQSQSPSLSTSGGVTLPSLLAPEVTKSREVGVKGSTYGGDLFGQISVFRTNKLGPRSYRTSTNDFLFTNAKIQVDGIEGEVHYAFNPMFDVYAHYAYQDAFYRNFTDGSGNDFSGNRVRMAPYHMAGVGANLRWGALTWNVSANYTGDRNLRDNNMTTAVQNLDPYTVVNTAITYRYENLSAQFVVNNIFDEYYIADDFSATESGYPGEPRSFALILRASF